MGEGDRKREERVGERGCIMFNCTYGGAMYTSKIIYVYCEFESQSLHILCHTSFIYISKL